MTTATKEPSPRNHDDKIRLWRRVGDLMIGDQSQTITKLDRLGRNVENGFAATNAKLADHDARFDRLEETVATINTRLDSIDDWRNEVDDWRERADAKFDQIVLSIESLSNRMDTQFETFENRTNARFENFENRMDARFESLENRINARFETLTALILRNETKGS